LREDDEIAMLEIGVERRRIAFEEVIGGRRRALIGKGLRIETRKRTVLTSKGRKRSRSTRGKRSSILLVTQEILFLGDAVKAVSCSVFWRLCRHVGKLKVQLFIKVRHDRGLVNDIKVLFIQSLHLCLVLLLSFFIFLLFLLDSFIVFRSIDVSNQHQRRGGRRGRRGKKARSKEGFEIRDKTTFLEIELKEGTFPPLC